MNKKTFYNYIMVVIFRVSIIFIFLFFYYCVFAVVFAVCCSYVLLLLSLPLQRTGDCV